MANLPSIRDLFPDFSDVFSPEFNHFLEFSNQPRVDLKETDDGYELIADMPGCSKEEVEVVYANETLTISAQHESHSEEKNEKENYLRKERSTVSYKRSFHLPNVKEEAITGAFKDGVLTLQLPKGEDQKPQVKKIELS